MKHVIRLYFIYCGDQRHLIVQIGILKKQPIFFVYSVQQMADIIKRTAPTADTVHLPVCILQQEICQMGADHACNASDQCFCAHFVISSSSF